MSSETEIIAKLRSDEKEIQEKLEQMRKPITQLEDDLQHIRGVITFYQRSENSKMMSGVQEAVAELMAELPISRIKGLSHSDAVVAIAKFNGGLVRTQDAKRLMIKAGIMSKTKNSTNMAHNAIQRTGKFERVSPGEYRLLPDKPKEEESIRRMVRLPFEVGTSPTQ